MYKSGYKVHSLHKVAKARPPRHLNNIMRGKTAKNIKHTNLKIGENRRRGKTAGYFREILGT